VEQQPDEIVCSQGNFLFFDYGVPKADRLRFRSTVSAGIQRVCG